MTPIARLTALSCAAALITGIAAAGPLNPPPGPVASTHKTLTEVEPRIPINRDNTPGDADSVYRITQPGSYYLIENLIVTSEEAGIEIAASNVTLDLMGFAITGDADPDLGIPGISLDGIRTVDLVTNVTVRNGVVANFGQEGVDLEHTLGGLGHRVENINASRNTSHGIVVKGAVVVDCVAWGNTGDGIRAEASTIEGCAALVNSGVNISGGFAAAIHNCSTVGGGARGIVTGNRSVVADCTAEGGGISVGDGSTVTNCAAQGNPGEGIVTGVGCIVSACSVYFSAGDGIVSGDGSTVQNCTIRTSLGNGIVAGSNCTIRDNTCTDGGNPGVSAGIRVNGSGNRIEGNACNNNDWGFRVTAGGNVIVRNTARGNTTNNWDVVAGNVCLVRQAALSGAITGNSGGTSPSGAAASDPDANYTY